MDSLARLDSWVGRISDRLDPMLVRCVRQDLRSKIFVGVFSLLLLISASAALIFATNAGSSTDSETPYGRYLFAALGWCWSFALIVVQASATHRLVAQERNDDTWDLVELTGLPPQRIVRGLLAASLTQSALYTAAMAPFLVMAYLLRGLDLLTIVAALITVPMLGVAAASFALLLACATPSKKARMAGGGLIGLLMLFAWSMTSGFMFNAYEFGLGRMLRSLVDGNTGAWMALGISFTAWASGVWLCLVLSATLLTHRANDRSTRPRFAAAMIWLAALLWLGGTVVFGDLAEQDRARLVAVIGFTGILWALIVGFFAMTEDYILTPRQAQAIAGAHGWRRRAAVLLGPGAARGRWFTIALALSAVALLGIALASKDDAHTPIMLGWYTLGYGLLVLLLGDVIARRLLGRWCSAPLHRRLTILGLLSAWSILPSLAALLVSEDGAAYAVLRLLTPGWGVYHYAVEDTTERGGAFDVVLMLLPLAMLAVAALQARRMTVVTRRVLAESGDRNPRS